MFVTIGINCRTNYEMSSARERLSAIANSITGHGAGEEYKFPAFDELPKVEGMPQGSLWGFYDKDGKKDEVGGERIVVVLLK